MKPILFLAVFLFTQFAMAGNIKRLFQDVKLPTQKVLEDQTMTTPIVAAGHTNYISTTTTTSASVTTTVTTFAHQPDVCRALVITPGSTTADVPTGNVVVTGKNIFGKTITENFAFAANASSATTGSAAFCSVSSIVYPIQDGPGATYTVGVADKLGLKRCMSQAGNGVFATFGGAFETTRGTWAADATHVEKNTYTPNGTLDGSTDVEVFFIQDYQCFP